MSIEILCTVLSIVTAIIAVVSPVITTIIHDKHDLKIRSMQFSATERLSLYQDFLDAFNETLLGNSFTNDTSLLLKKSFSKVYIVCSDTTQHLLDELENYISYHADSSIGLQEDYRKLHKSIVRSMRNDLKALR